MREVWITPEYLYFLNKHFRRAEWGTWATNSLQELCSMKLVINLINPAPRSTAR